MARTGFFHHIGSFFLLAATVLLIVVSISAPVVNDIALLKVKLSNATDDHRSALTFGTFGYCVTTTAAGHDVCTGTHIGYNPVAEILRIDSNIDDDFSSASTKAAKTLTKIMILHPIAAGVAFIAFLLALGAGVVGSFIGSLVSLVAFVITAVVLITDFVLFSILRRHINNTSSIINNNSNSSTNAKYGVALWLLLAAAICSLIGTVVVFLTCCSARLHSSRNVSHHKVEPSYVAPARTRRGRFF
ncbi:ph-response regulator [Ophiostoma piceae UAMH 11346]|uniref:Ph-response regulator n=1 Tax=Ophiostoma piceae (strain UAMH 11346) TaxID=1262450 RepID=S3C9P2_OPHP1|nr:ph-response regulator [Ophiostoma piceae UAMH 11346]